MKRAICTVILREYYVCLRWTSQSPKFKFDIRIILAPDAAADEGALGVTPAAPPLFATTPFIHPHCIIVIIPFNHGYARTCAQNPVYGAIVRSANPRPACVYLRCINAPYTSHMHFQLITRTTRGSMRIMPVSSWKDIRSFPGPFRAVYNAVIQPKISVMHKPPHCNVVKR